MRKSGFLIVESSRNDGKSWDNLWQTIVKRNDR